MAEFKKRLGALWARQSQSGEWYTGQLEVEESVRAKIADMIRNGEKVPIQLQSVRQEPGKQRPTYNIVLNEWNKNAAPANKPSASSEFVDDCPF